MYLFGFLSRKYGSKGIGEQRGVPLQNSSLGMARYPSGFADLYIYLLDHGARTLVTCENQSLLDLAFHILPSEWRDRSSERSRSMTGNLRPQEIPLNFRLK